MGTKMVDVTIHIDEKISGEQLEALRDKLLAQKGVMAADYHNDKPHLMIVEYNPDIIDSTKFLGIAAKMNLHAELIGM